MSIRSSNFQNRSHQRKLEEPTDITQEVYQIAKGLLAELWKGRTPLRLLGISLTQIVREDAMQTTLFRDEKREKARRLDHTLDDLRGRFGLDTIKLGSAYQTSLEVGKKYKAHMENQRERKGKP